MTGVSEVNAHAGEAVLSADVILSQPEVEKAYSALDHTTRLIAGHWITQSLYAAARLNLADRIRDGYDQLPRLAEITESHPPSLERLMRALVSVGVFHQEGDKYQLSSFSERLLEDLPDSQREAVLAAGEHAHNSWGELIYSVRTGQSGFEEAFGMPIFEYLNQNPVAGKMFDAAMTGFHGREIASVVATYDFRRFSRLIDLGGGNGALMTAILNSHPQGRGIVFDLPGVADRTRAKIAASPLASRCEVVGGDFRECRLPTADAYIFRHVIHNWDDEKVIRILGNVRQSMPRQARLLLLESVIPPGNAPFFGKLLDLAMLVIPGGKERTAAEYEDLLRQAGFQLQAIAQSDAEACVIEAAPSEQKA